MASASLEKILAGIRHFQSAEYPKRKDLFTSLAGGQSPTLLLVTCSDSRIDPGLLTQTDPGEVFVVRNAGNFVPPEGAGGGEAATIEYGIEALGIPHIAVCGHTKCGAMAATLDPKSAASLPAVTAWIEHGKPALSRSTTLNDEGDELSNAVAANVLAQLEHLRTLPAVQRAIERGALTLHGWVYDFVAGELYVADAAGDFLPLQEI